MKNRVIRDRYAALVILSQRVLPSPTAINKVSTLLITRFQPAYEATEQSRKQVIRDLPLPANYDESLGRLPIALAEARSAAMDDMLELSQPVRKIPDLLRLRSADLPKALKREGGESNAEGIANIRMLLGSLYVPDAEERIDDTLEGEEGDEGDEAGV